MPEIKKEPYTTDEDGNPLNEGSVIFNEDHSIADIVRYAVKCGDIETVQFILDEIRKEHKPNPVMLNGKLHQFMIRVSGVSQKCPANCGCNVFHKPDDTRLNLYECNSCKVQFEAN